MVNRLWMHHFGRGIVATVSNFGRLGTPPSHPELLDWLATEFVRRGWSMKSIHRLIMTSAAYRQSSQTSPEKLTADPENSPAFADAAAAHGRRAAERFDSGGNRQLDPEAFGPPVRVKKESDRARSFQQARRNRDIGGAFTTCSDERLRPRCLKFSICPQCRRIVFSVSYSTVPTQALE